MSLAAAEVSDAGSSDATFETFDSFDTIEADAEASDDWSKPEKEEKVSEDLKVIKDSQADSEGKVIKEDGEEDADEKEVKKVQKSKKEESFDDEEEGEEEESEEVAAKEDKPEDQAPKAKLRMKMGNDLYNITSDATFKVKVDGETLDVPVQELINNYSGKTAWDKKFTELGKDKKSLEVERNTLQSQKNGLLDNMKRVLEPLKDPTKNPIDSVLYLVEMSGDDPYTAWRSMMEANIEEVGQLLDMTETERELYFHKKKDELHSSVARKRQEKIQSEQAFKQVVQRVDSLRQTYNVSEEAFVDASDELESIYNSSGLDINDITEEAIVDYASLKPHIEVVRGLVEPYEENISEGKYGDVVSELSRYLRDGKADVDTVKQILARNFSVEEDVKELNTKLYQKQKAKPSRKVENESSNGFESFDDWN
jgi:hypothetical protein